MDNGASSYRRFRNDGDENALVEIIKDYKDGLIFYLNSFVGNIQIAEELAEETFVLLGTKKPKDKGNGSFKTWLYTIGRNITIDYLRKNSRRNEISIDECTELSIATEEFESLYIKEQQRIIVHHAMSRLKSEHRQVLWLVYFEGFNQKQVASVMKKSVHSIEQLVYRAKDSLKKQLEKEGYTYEELR